MKRDRYFLWYWIDGSEPYWNLINDNIVVEGETQEQQLDIVRKRYIGRACVFDQEMVYGYIYEDKLHGGRVLLQSANYHQSIPIEVPHQS